MSRATELSSLGQGLAAGCLSHGVAGVTSNKMALESAFTGAWGAWSAKGRFTTVRADPERNDILRIIYDAERRRSGHIATWVVDSPWLRPQLRHSWNLNDAAELLASGGTWDEWRELSYAFLGDLKDEEILRDIPQL